MMPSLRAFLEQQSVERPTLDETLQQLRLIGL